MDDNISDADNYRRYVKFKDLTFPTVPESEWPGYLADLVRLEGGLVWGDAIGHMPKYPFRFVVTDPSPFKQRPIMYPRDERQWISQYMES